MVPYLFVRRVPAAVAAILLWNVAGIAISQQIGAPLDSGFARTSSIDMSVDEMLGSRKTRALTEPILGPGYPELWIGEVQYKPVRLMRLEIRDPKTGVVKKELVRYMVYRMILRDPTELAGAETEELRRKLADPNLDPLNALDPNVTVPLQLPRFILKTEDNDIKEVYVDEINLEIQKSVFQREFGRRGLKLKMHNSVEAIGEIGAPVLWSAGPTSAFEARTVAKAKAAADGLNSRGSKKVVEEAEAVANELTLSYATYGVAVWRNVNPKADFFSVIMSGFSNAYRISTDANGTHLVEEKVIVQRFARPGDEFEQDEQEFRFIDDLDTDGDGKIDIRYPNWQYQARDAKLNIDHMDEVLRNAKVSFADAQKPAAADAGNAEVDVPKELPAEKPEN